MSRQKTLLLTWKRFRKLTDTWEEFGNISCIYVQTASDGIPKRIGKATKGLNVRYHGGTGYAIDAAMDNSGNLIFVAKVNLSLIDNVEKVLIWRERHQVKEYNTHGTNKEPALKMELIHEGDSPRFSK